MALGKRKRVSVNRPCALRRCKIKMSSTNIESLPDELALEILKHLRAEDIFEAAMAVCRKWYNMIHTRNFICTHLEYSAPGFIIQYHLDREHPMYVSMVQGKIEISKMDYEYRSLCWSSCNGLTLEFHDVGPDRYALGIVNPVTKQLFELPPFGSFYPLAWAYSGIAYVAASMEYKVVCISDPNEMGNTPVELLGCAILTVGVDKSWRHVDIQHLSLTAKELFNNTPLTTEGFLHWTDREVGNHILTLNVETEVITETRVPRGCKNGGKESKYCLSNGRTLTVVIACTEFSWDVWELKKPEIGEWVKIIHIDLEGQKWKFEQFRYSYPTPHITLEPVAWLNYKEGLLMRVMHPDQCASEDSFVYNVGKQEIEFLDLNPYCDCVRFLVHRNSLMWLDG